MSRFQPKASHFIDGAFVEDAAGAPFKSVYPGTGETIATLNAATPAIIDAALASAQEGQKAWAAMTGAERGRILRRAADRIRDRNREIAEIETHDTGKPLQETLLDDATAAADAFEYFGALAASLTGEQIPLSNGDFAYTVREPLGVCVGIGAWNYPSLVAAWKAAPALACGNAMVFKPSELTPLSALTLAEILIDAGAPKGVFNVVQGMGEAGAALTTDPRVAKVSLTGSVPTGRKVYAAAAAQMKHVTMELGGKSPLLVFDDADIDSAVSGAFLGNFYSSGQICSNGTRVFVQRDLMEDFLDRVIGRLANVVIGDPMDEAVNFGPLVSQAQLEKVMGYIAKAKQEGARLVCGGRRLNRPGFFVEPTVFADVTDDMTIAREEVFGPVMSVLEFDDEEEAIARANATEFGLAAGVYTSDLARAHRVASRFEAGTCYINSYNLAPVEAPFGGVKMSGVGRENSRLALDHYSQMKTVFVSVNKTEAPY